MLASEAIASGNIDAVRDLTRRVRPVIGSALICPDITRSRSQAIVEPRYDGGQYQPIELE